jgi:hypothetical protein
MGIKFAPPLLVALLSGAALAAPNPAAPVRPTLVAGELEPADELLRAGADGAEWALPGGSSLIAAPGSELRVLGKPLSLDLGRKQRVPGFTVLVKKGFVRARVPEKAQSAIVFAAPRRTSVLVSAGETSLIAGEHLAVANVTGKVSVGIDGQRLRPIEAGMLEILDTATPTRRPLLKSPKALTGTPVLVSFGGEVPFGEFGWDSVNGAVGYRIELREAGSDRLRARVETKAPLLAAGFARVAPGAYRLRVVSLDGSGLESAHPLERSLHVVSVALPPAAYVESANALRLPAGASVALSHAEGVEVALGADASFALAPPALALAGREPRLVRLRPPGDGYGASLWLLPRQAKAHVEFEPRAPRWPDAPLEIRVRLEETGGAPPDWVEARPKVTVGVDPVEVAFVREGAWLRGSLPPRAGKGPWVVRVEVSDQYGGELGRDFVEVASR